MDTESGATPHIVVHQEDRVRLKYYPSSKAAAGSTPLLLVHALFHRDTVLDLQPDRSVVQRFLAAGMDVYLIDWGYPSRQDRFLTLDDHINGYMQRMVALIRRRRQNRRINLAGFCIGGTMAVLYAALHPQDIQNLITVVAPTDFDTDKGLLHLWLKELDAERLVDTFGNLPGSLLNLAFLLQNPARLMLDKYIGFLENMDNQEFVANFIRMEKWIFDSPDVPGETLRQILKDLYQENRLMRGGMTLGGAAVDLAAITMPVFNVYGQYDHLVPPEACQGLCRRVASRDTLDLCLDTGHIGIYVSSHFHQEVIPRIAAWLRERQG
jgi:polyhydroxyalkanoate synthase